MKTKKFDLVAWFNNLPIRVKLGIGFGVITGLALLMGGIMLFLGRIEAQSIARLDQAAARQSGALDLQRDLLQMRRHEKDFLLRYEDLGYASARAQYADLNDAQYQEVVGNILELQGQNSDGGEEESVFANTLNTVEAQFGVYYTFFKVLVIDDIPARGTLAEGPIPETRAQIERLEELLQEGQAYDLVRHVDELAVEFSDYVTVSAPGHAPLDSYVPMHDESVARLNGTLDELQQGLDDNTSLSVATVREATTLVAGIRQELADLAALNVKTARDIENFRDAAHTIEPVLDQFVADQTTEMEITRTAYDQVHAGAQFAQSIILVASLALAVVLIAMLNQSISEPIGALTDVARKMAQGDLLIRASAKTRDEVGTLGRAFNAMAGALHSRQAELQRANADLEDRVKQRTVDLQIALGEAREANRLKDLFLATMSHELRTPLNAIIGFLGLLMYSDDMTEDNLYMTERAMTNSERLLGLINNILDLSRIGSGRLEIIPVEMSPKRLAEQVYNDMRLQVQEKELAFELEVDDRLPEMIIHDEERITQIIINLVGNAIKFTDEGTIRLMVRRSDNERLIIKVSDTGVGIPLTKQELIFDEFTQVDMDSTRRHGGAGLGLSIVKKLAVLMQGTVRVESEDGRGSMFTVDLPLNLEEAPALLPVE